MGDPYPSDELMHWLRNCGVETYADCERILSSVVEAWSTYGRIDRDGRRYTFITGGWSGNEDLIGAMSANLVFWGLCWESSHRGGTHVFELPLLADKDS